MAVKLIYSCGCNIKIKLLENPNKYKFPHTYVRWSPLSYLQDIAGYHSTTNNSLIN